MKEGKNGGFFQRATQKKKQCEIFEPEVISKLPRYPVQRGAPGMIHIKKKH